MDISFLLGLISAIPIGILGNLLTPKVQTFLSRNSEKYRRKRQRDLSRELSFVTFLAADRTALIAYVARNMFYHLSSILVIVSLSALLLIAHADAVFRVTIQSPPSDIVVRYIANKLGAEGEEVYKIYFQILNLTLLVYSGFIIFECLKLVQLVKLFKKVYSFDSYKREVEAIINLQEEKSESSFR